MIIMMVDRFQLTHAGRSSSLASTTSFSEESAAAFARFRRYSLSLRHWSRSTDRMTGVISQATLHCIYPTKYTAPTTDTCKNKIELLWGSWFVSQRVNILWTICSESIMYMSSAVTNPHLGPGFCHRRISGSRWLSKILSSKMAAFNRNKRNDNTHWWHPSHQ